MHFRTPFIITSTYTYKSYDASVIINYQHKTHVRIRNRDWLKVLPVFRQFVTWLIFLFCFWLASKLIFDLSSFHFLKITAHFGAV
jgi:hypothetical protein